jgi:hypothetical protein
MTFLSSLLLILLYTACQQKYDMRFSTLLAALATAAPGLRLVIPPCSVNTSDTVSDTPVKFNGTTGPINAHISNATQIADVGPKFHNRAITFDPKKGADDAMWTRYIGKGEHSICLMEATDAGASWLESNSRSPPSAASKWTGDLRGSYDCLANTNDPY